LKRLKGRHPQTAPSVAPRAGAWIETSVFVGFPADYDMSPLAQGRGLKHRLRNSVHPNRRVAPRAGAWIETTRTGRAKASSVVAPRAGAWIETTFLIGRHRPPNVAPRAGAWIETRLGNAAVGRRIVAPRAGAWIETAPW